MLSEHDKSGPTAVDDNINRFEVTPKQSGSNPTVTRPGNSAYQSHGESIDPVQHYHPGTALFYSVPMAAREESLTAPLTADIHDVTTRIETTAETMGEWLAQDAPESIRDTVRKWGDNHDIDDPFLVGPRYAALQFLLKTTLYATYARRNDLPILNGDIRDALTTAANKTGNRAFEASALDTLVWHSPGDVVAELCWWRCGLTTATSPADDIGELFEELVPATTRGSHGQFRTPAHISETMRELATCNGDSILDAGIGAGALSVPRDQSRSSQTYGVEQSRIGFLMAVTSLALTDQSGIVHRTDFFDIEPATLGMDPDAAIHMGRDTGEVDILPGNVGAAIGNPPYVANRNLDRERSHYRQHLHAFGGADQSPYVDGDKRISGRSDLFVYFVTHATQFLAEGGRLVYLLPRKWLETKYGETLQTFLFDHYQVTAIIEFEDTVFDDAQVNAVILVADRCTNVTTRQNTATQFITITNEMTPARIRDLVEGDDTDTLASDNNIVVTAQREDGFRVVTVKQSHLVDRDGPDGPLTQYFRAPAPLQSLKQNEMLVPLDTLATVTYGHKTGNNDFFLLDGTDLDTWPLADRFYRAAVDDLGRIPGYHLSAQDTDTYLLDVHSYVTSLDDHHDDGSSRSRPQQVKAALAHQGHENLLAYIKQWEASRDAEPAQPGDVWFDVGPVDAPGLVHPYRVHETFRVFRNTDEVVPTNCANGLDVNADVDTGVLLGYLNSTVHAAFLELWCQSEGGGSLEVTTRSLQQVPVADVRAFTDTDRNAILAAFDALTEGIENAQTQLDDAVLNAIGADINASILQELTRSLTVDRLPNR